MIIMGILWEILCGKWWYFFIGRTDFQLLIRNLYLENLSMGPFWSTFQVKLYSHYFCDFQKKVLDPNEPYISTSQTKMSVISEFCLYVYSVSTAYISLRKDLRYLIKVPYSIQNYSNLATFLIFETLCLGSSKTLPYEKSICVW